MKHVTDDFQADLTEDYGEFNGTEEKFQEAVSKFDSWPTKDLVGLLTKDGLHTGFESISDASGYLRWTKDVKFKKPKGGLSTSIEHIRYWAKNYNGSCLKAGQHFSTNRRHLAMMVVRLGLTPEQAKLKLRPHSSLVSSLGPDSSSSSRDDIEENMPLSAMFKALKQSTAAGKKPVKQGAAPRDSKQDAPLHKDAEAVAAAATPLPQHETASGVAAPPPPPSPRPSPAGTALASGSTSAQPAAPTEERCAEEERGQEEEEEEEPRVECQVMADEEQRDNEEEEGGREEEGRLSAVTSALAHAGGGAGGLRGPGPNAAEQAALTGLVQFEGDGGGGCTGAQRERTAAPALAAAQGPAPAAEGAAPGGGARTGAPDAGASPKARRPQYSPAFTCEKCGKLAEGEHVCANQSNEVSSPLTGEEAAPMEVTPESNLEHHKDKHHVDFEFRFSHEVLSPNQDEENLCAEVPSTDSSPSGLIDFTMERLGLHSESPLPPPRQPPKPLSSRPNVPSTAIEKSTRLSAVEARLALKRKQEDYWLAHQAVDVLARKPVPGKKYGEETHRTECYLSKKNMCRATTLMNTKWFETGIDAKPWMKCKKGQLMCPNCTDPDTGRKEPGKIMLHIACYEAFHAIFDKENYPGFPGSF